MQNTASIITTIIAFLISYALTTVLGPAVINILKREKASQTERELGLESHKKKNGTPTMGGFIFLIPLAFLPLFFGNDIPKTISVMVLTLGFGLIGFIDDFIKVVLHRNMGLNVPQKLIAQFIVTVLFVFILARFSPEASDIFRMRIPFFKEASTDLGIFKFPALFIITLATVNGTNFTDGVDGLCASVTAVIAAFFTGYALIVKTGVFPVSAIFFAAMLGYLFFNVYPGRVMMGDTGSLAIGGFIVAMSYVLHLPLFIPIFGIIYAVEVISVVLQVGYFKATHGKRLFKMAPIHHHFEKGGWSETRVVNAFTTLTIIGCAVSILALII